MAKKPLWIFSDGPTGTGDPAQLTKGFTLPENLKVVARRVKPRDVAFFHGVIDIDKLKFAEKMIIRAMKAPVGDFRDWDMIHDWADMISISLNQLQT